MYCVLLNYGTWMCLRRPNLIKHSYIIHTWSLYRNIQNAIEMMMTVHRMHTRHKHTQSAWRNTHTSHTRAPTAPRVTIQTKTQHPSHPLHKHTTYFNTPRLKTLSLTTAATQQTFPQTPHNHYNRHKNNMRHIHTSIVSRHLATRGNNKILRTPPQHISSSEEILPPHSSHPCPTQNK